MPGNPKELQPILLFRNQLRKQFAASVFWYIVLAVFIGGFWLARLIFPH